MNPTIIRFPTRAKLGEAPMAVYTSGWRYRLRILGRRLYEVWGVLAHIALIFLVFVVAIVYCYLVHDWVQS